MKTRKLLSLLLTVFILATLIPNVVLAKQSIDTGVMDFEGYAGEWNATSNSDSAVLPTYTGGSFAKSGNTAPNASNGVTNGTPSGSSVNGNSLKVYYAYNESYTDNYGGFQYSLSEGLENTFRVEFSLYYDQSLGGEYLYFRDSSSSPRALYITSARKVNLFGTGYAKDASGNDIALELDKWYDFDILYNINNKEFRVVISDSDGVVTDTTGVSAENAITKLTRIDLRSYAAIGNKNNNKNNGVAEIYFDNLRVSSEWKNIDSGSNAQIDSFDFSKYTGTDLATEVTGSYGSFSHTAGKGGKATDSVNGTAFALNATAANDNLRYTIRTQVSKDLYSSVDFKLSDLNFKELRFRYYYDGSSLFLSKGISDAALIITSTNRIVVFGTTLKNADGSYYLAATDKWYNFTLEHDTNTGNVVTTFSDGENTFTVTKYLGEACVGVGVYRLHTYITALDTGTTQSTILFDNLKFGYTDDINYYALHEYEASEIAAGGSSSVTVPMTGTSFMYNTTVTTADASDCTVAATVGEGSVTLATIGGEAGEYGLKMIVNPKDYTATVTVTPPLGEAATTIVSLGSAAVDVDAITFANASAESSVTLGAATLESVYDFALDNDKSTTGSAVKLKTTDSVKAVFTNKIDKTSFTPSTVTMPYNNNVEYTLSFPDDYTVQVNFEREPGTHYHIAFTDVKDIYGNALTDYIEFDTVLPNLFMTDVQFMRNGSLLTLASPGRISAEFTAQANNGNSYDMMYTLALYKGMELASVATDSFTVGSTKEPHTLTLNIPDDGSYYVAKAFLWDETLKPYTKEKILKPTTDLPVVLLRFDDLKSQKISVFDEVTQWLDDYDIKAGYGFMGYQLLDNVSSTIRDEVDEKIVAMKNNPRIELWYHGYKDENMYEGKTEDEQRADFESGINGAYEKYGIVFTTFAPPSNKFDATTIKLMNDEFTNFKVFMTKDTPEDVGYEGDCSFTVLNKYVTVEANDAILPLETLKANWQAAVDAGYEYVIMYNHPGYSWNKLTTGSETEYGKDTLTDFVEYLKSEGAVFMNPTEYAEYAEAIR